MADQDSSLRGKTLKAMLTVARKEPRAFAFCPGKTTKGDVFLMHRKLSEQTLQTLKREAKSAGESAKVAYGAASVESKVLSLRCETALKGLARTMKRYLQAERHPMTVRILDANGDLIEEEIEERPWAEDAEAQAGGQADDKATIKQRASEAHDAPSADPTKADLTARAKALKASFEAAPASASTKLAPAFKAAIAALQDGQYETAADAFAKLEAAVVKLGDAIPAPSAGTGLERLQAVGESLAKRIGALEDEAARSKLTAAHGMLTAQIEGGDLKKASATAKALGAALAKAAGPTEREQPAPVDDRAWRAAGLALCTSVEDQLERGYGDTAKLRAAWAFFNDKGEDGAYDEAMKIVPGLKSLLRRAEAEERAEAEAGVSPDRLPLVHARLNWSKTRAGLHAEILKLQSSIIEVCTGEAFDGIEARTDQLFSHLDRIDVRLEDLLSVMADEADDARRAGLGAEARSTVAQYKSELDSPFFKDVDANNGFASVSVREAALSTLAHVEAALSESAA